MLYIKLFIEREKNTGQSAPECPFKGSGSGNYASPCSMPLEVELPSFDSLLTNSSFNLTRQIQYKY